MQRGGDKTGLEHPAESEPPETNEMNDQTNDGGGDIKLNPRAQALIGQKLKRAYEELVQEPVPDHLLKLLEELERKEKEE